jgi:nicotinamidase-related amidase
MHPLPLKLDDFLRPDRVALVMWDMQNGLGGRAPERASIVANLHKLLERADRLKIPVIWSHHIAPPLEQTAGPFLLWLMKKQKLDDPSKIQAANLRGTEDTKFVEGLSPAPHHLVIEKSQPSFFIDTPLALRLKAMDRDTLVIGGVATDIGIEFTCRHAAALGYYTVVAEDASGAYTREAHERSLAFLRSWTTPVVSTAAICASWDARVEPGDRHATAVGMR